jgi:clathrin heavy chain
MAINVLVEYIVSIDRALDLTNKINKSEVRRRLAKTLRLLVVDTVYFYDFLPTYFFDSYIKAADSSNFAEVIEIASQASKHIHFLRTIPKSLREPKTDAEPAYVYAKTDRLTWWSSCV